MAKLYADQGYLRKAAEIYRHLIHRNPERHDLTEALAQVERQIGHGPAPNRKDVELLLREWIEMMKLSQYKRKRHAGRRKKDEE